MTVISLKPSTRDSIEEISGNTPNRVRPVSPHGECEDHAAAEATRRAALALRCPPESIARFRRLELERAAYDATQARRAERRRLRDGARELESKVALATWPRARSRSNAAAITPVRLGGYGGR